MMELGNQQMFGHPKIEHGYPAKQWFISQGVREHVSIDTNGLLGSLPMDLSKPIGRPEFFGAFDIVTDFGTSEHVGATIEDFYHCRANCHRWCRVGGLLLFVNPATGFWKGHGTHYFTMEHYRRLRLALGYAMLELREGTCVFSLKDGLEIYAAVVKCKDSPFMPLDQYKNLCAETIFSA